MSRKPQRIRRRRTKGWRMPEGAVCVSRGTRWGNPFIVGKHGTVAECVDLYRKLLAGYLCLTTGNCDAQEAAREALEAEKRAGWPTLRGHDLVCWCRVGSPCHADILLELANG